MGRWYEYMMNMRERIRWIRSEVDNIVHKIMEQFYIYVILYIIVIVYPDSIGRRTEVYHSRSGKEYVPKSKRGKIRKAITEVSSRYIFKWAETVTKWCESINLKRRPRKYDPKKFMKGRSVIKKYMERASRIIAYSVVAMTAGNTQSKSKEEQIVARFDTDSDEIGIDNRCSACISHKIEDFIGAPIETNKTIKGFGGSRVENIMKGTIKWKWSDDSGRNHTFIIPNSYYVPSGSVRLLSPQHWAQSLMRQQGNKDEIAGCDTKHNKVIMYWDKGSSKLTIPISKNNNVATFFLAAGYRKFGLFCEQAEIDYEKQMREPMICMPVDIEKQEIIQEEEKNKNEMKLNWPKLRGVGTYLDMDKRSIEESERDRKGDPKMGSSIEAEFLNIHQRYGHISFRRLKEMAEQGIINKKYSRSRIPVCSTCRFAKASKRRWRDKPRSIDQTIDKEVKPGGRVSVK